jgi:hypothetical protein
MVRNRSDNLNYQDILLTTTERKRMDPMILLSSCMSNSKLQESSNRSKKISLSIRHRLSRDLVVHRSSYHTKIRRSLSQFTKERRVSINKAWG